MLYFCADALLYNIEDLGLLWLLPQYSRYNSKP